VDNIAQTEGEWLQYATRGVRIGGGYHLFSVPADRSTSQSPRNADTTQLRQRAATPERQTRSVQSPAKVPSQFKAGGNPHSATEEATLLDVHSYGNQFSFDYTVDNDAATYASCARMQENLQAASHPDEQLVTSNVDEWLDYKMAKGAHLETVLPLDRQNNNLYDHYAHGVPSQGTSPVRFSVGAYSPPNPEHTSLNRREIAEAVRNGSFDNLQLYRVLKSDFEHSTPTPQPRGNDVPPLRQGNWLPQSRAGSRERRVRR